MFCQKQTQRWHLNSNKYVSKRAEFSAASRHFTSFAASENNVGREKGHLFCNVLVLESIAESFAEFSMQFWMLCFEKDVMKRLEKIGETNRNGQRSRKSVLKKIWLNCTLTANKRNDASFHNCAEILQPESVGDTLRYGDYLLNLDCMKSESMKTFQAVSIVNH